MINIPTPAKGENQKKFINRCIPFVKKEHPEWEQKKCVAVCYSIWRNRKKAIEVIKSIKDDIVSIKSIIVNKVITPPLTNIHKIKPPKVEENKKKKKPCIK